MTGSGHPTSLPSMSCLRSPLGALMFAGTAWIAGNSWAEGVQGRRYADFSDARAAVEVSGAAVYDSEVGFTVECRMWVDSVRATSISSFPASIMFQHRSSVDHKWLGLDSGRPTGLVVGWCRSWWDGQWTRADSVVPLQRWVHLAYVIKDGVDRVYVDGQMVAASADSCARRQNGASMQLGAARMDDLGVTLDSFGGKLDWIRVSSVARYQGVSFVVPSEDSLMPDAMTNLLVTFNGDSAADAFVDLSPNQHSLVPGSGVPGGEPPAIVPDCNGNGTDDRTEIAAGILVDVDSNGVPDGCERISCEDADLFADRNVNGADLGILLSQWGAIGPYTVSDLNLDGAVDGIDLGLLLSFWGPCPY